MQDVFKRKRLAGQSLRGRDWQGSYWVLKIYHWRVDALTVSITLLQVSDTRIATTLALDCSCHPTLAADEFYSFGTDCSFPSMEVYTISSCILNKQTNRNRDTPVVAEYKMVWVYAHWVRILGNVEGTHMINLECTTAHTRVCTVWTLVRGWLAAAKDQRLLINSRLGGFIHTYS